MIKRLFFSSVSTDLISFLELVVCCVCLVIVMIIMSTVSHHQQQLKRTHSDHHDDHYYHPQQHQLTLSTINCPTKNIRQIKNSCEEEEKLFNHQRCKRSSCDWSLNHRKKIKRTSEKRASQLDDNDDEHFHSHQYHCFVFLKFYSSTLKCSIDVLVKSNDQLPTDLSDDQQSILIGKSRISRSIKPGVIRIRLVSSLFKADADVHEDPSLIKLETIRNSKQSNHFDKQFALLFTVTISFVFLFSINRFSFDIRMIDLVRVLSENYLLNPSILKQDLIQIIHPYLNSI